MAENKTAPRLRVGIVGGTGYTGVELLRLLACHPCAEVVAITSRKEAGTKVAAMFPSLRGFYPDLAFSAPDEADLEGCDFVFFATPHGVAMSNARRLTAAGARVIDLAADFRLKDPAVFAKWYKMEHACPDLLAEAVYGQPETMREAMKSARIVGMAGCYPTSIELGLLPLLEYERAHPGTFELSTIIADSKSGISGAGKKADVTLLCAENSDSVHAYAVKGHRHQPEIEQQLRLFAGDDSLRIAFVPHLLPTIRGIHSTIYLRLKDPAADIDLQGLFEARYAGEYFVDVMPAGSHPETRSVRGSNFARIAVHRPGGGDLVVVLVVEDNLVKGAAGQALQAMNLMAGLPEKTGLDHPALLP
ncbi:MAG: N-acetyl-gamma-glutamyl-phosphate reductase [Duodenibacillus sp.]|nr:N-acetyl-gamma-glutamyl-phosphate reductase [Duodenibacillus sp.]